MMSLLGSEAAALLPGMTGAASAATVSATTPPAFADVLNSALDGLAAPDAAMLALLMPATSLLTPAATAVPLEIPVSAMMLEGATADDTVDTLTAGGNSLPLAGSNVPPLNLAELPELSGAVNPNTTVFPSLAMSSAPAPAAAMIDDARLHETALSLPDVTTADNAVEQDAAAEPALADADLAAVAADAQQNGARRDSHRDEHAASPDKKSAVMDGLSALSSVLAPLNSAEAVAKRDSVAVTLSTPIARIGDTAPVSLDGSTAINGGVSAPAAAPATALSKTELSIPQSPQQPGWGDAFSDRVHFMVKQNLQEAEIRLNPPQLGQIDVRISLTNDQANLIFSSPHASVRDAIETSMVRLRELLGESGINLANVDVSDKSLAQQQRGTNSERDAEHPGIWNGYRAEFALDENAGTMLGASGNGRIDYYV